jgi:metal-responsive CopG/Arc/MetJ family transcriptional regulator
MREWDEYMFSGSIKLKKELSQRVERCAKAGGYSSPQEFVEHIIERELAKLEEAQSDEEIVKKLKGLGYID